MIGMDISRQPTVSGVDEVEEEDAFFFDFLDDALDVVAFLFFPDDLFFDFLDDDALDVLAFLFFPDDDDDDDELEFDFASSSS